MKRLITMICLVAALAGRAAAQGAVYGDIALAGSVSLTNLYGQPAAVWAAQRQGGAWTNDGAHVWYRLAATNRHGRSGWVYSTNDVVLNVATGRQSATVSWTNALGGVSGYLLQRRETTNSVADPAAATNAALWTRWQALSPRVGAVLDLSWTNWSTNAWADLPGWDHARTYPWATPADIATGTVSHAATAGTAASAGTAATADRLNDTVGTNSWAVLANGTQQVYVVSYSQVVCTDTTVVRVASAIVDMEEPPDYSAAVGDIWAWNPAGYYERQNWKLLAGWRVRDEHGDASNNIGASPTNIVYYHDTFWELSFEFPLATNSVPVTNIYPLARSADLAAHNADGSAHADIRAAIDAIPLPPTNAVAGWFVWDSGSNVFWRVSATNLRFYVWP